ncbi:MAG TPA: uracil-DNA glycosylase [Fimbriimonas sp.]
MSGWTSLLELQESARECLACPLANRRTHVVFGEGNATSPLVLIGEGPGETEDKTGRPFVGKAGKLLDKAIEEAGLRREDLYITNTVKCRAADWSSGRPVNRPPAPEETLACRQWLVPQLGFIQPKVILCIGAPSAKNLIKKDFAITKERGKYFPCEFARTAIATLHPSYILRNMHGGSDGGYSLLVGDIRRAWEAADRLSHRSANHDRTEEDQRHLF